MTSVYKPVHFIDTKYCAKRFCESLEFGLDFVEENSIVFANQKYPICSFINNRIATWFSFFMHKTDILEKKMIMSLKLRLGIGALCGLSAFDSSYFFLQKSNYTYYKFIYTEVFANMFK